MGRSSLMQVDHVQWASAQWGTVALGDKRLSSRAVQVGARLLQRPAASLPQQMQTRAELKGAYALLKNPKVTHEDLQSPHWQATRAATAGESVVLMIQDITELDYTRYAETMSGLAPIGDGRGRGLLLHSTLAVLPGSRRVLGLAHQQVARRVPTPAGTKRRQRPPEQRESRLWKESLKALGAPPPGVRWVLVADRAADQTALWVQCAAQLDFVIRASYEHRLVGASEEAAYLLSTTRQWPAQAAQRLPLRATPKRKAREADLRMSFGPVEIRTSRKRGASGLPLWAVRIWEPAPPPGAEAIEWILMTSRPVQRVEQAQEIVAWYTARWLVEDYHQCLKSGCAVERRDLEKAERIERLLGIVAVVAMRLLQLRQEARVDPEQPASAVAPALAVHFVATHLQQDPAQLSARDFWRGVARLGGFLGRRADGDPGWKTLWRGWLEIEAWMRAVELISQAPLLPQPPPTYG